MHDFGEHVGLRHLLGLADQRFLCFDGHLHQHYDFQYRPQRRDCDRGNRDHAKDDRPASAKLNYTLFRDSAHTKNWGNTVGTDTLLSQGNCTALQFSVYGQILAGQYVAPGAYSDTIIATVTY
jgi:hypothetical protein